MTNKKRINILNITLIAVFAACAFVAVWIQIPLPAAVGTPFLHLGNLVVILVSLLFGPIIGAASGAIGMGLYDIIKGYGIWSIKTIVLKFGIGLVVGFIYLFIKKKTSKSLIKVMYVSSIIFLFISLITFGLRIFVGKEFFLEILNKNINIDWTLYTFTFIIGLSLLISAIFTKKINRSVQLALLASTFGVFFNIIGEFLGKVIKQLLISSPLNVALIQAAISIPATIINGTISIVAIIFVFAPLKKAIGDRKSVV